MGVHVSAWVWLPPEHAPHTGRKPQGLAPRSRALALPPTCTGGPGTPINPNADKEWWGDDGWVLDYARGGRRLNVKNRDKDKPCL